MKVRQRGANCTFVELDDGSKHCFSYNQCVASIINGKYTEYKGEKYYSRTSNKHKSMFRRFYNVA